MASVIELKVGGMGSSPAVEEKGLVRREIAREENVFYLEHFTRDKTPKPLANGRICSVKSPK